MINKDALQFYHGTSESFRNTGGKGPLITPSVILFTILGVQTRNLSVFLKIRHFNAHMGRRPRCEYSIGYKF